MASAIPSHPFLLAVFQNDAAEVRRLLEAETSAADGRAMQLLNEVNPADGKMALHIAASENALAVLDLLLRQLPAVDVDARTSTKGNTAFHFSVFRGHDRAAMLLLARGSDPKAVDSLKRSALHLCCLGGHAGLLPLLEEQGLDIRAPSADSTQPIHFAALSGSVPSLEWLLTRDSSLLLATTSDGLTPLHLAAMKGHASALSVLISRLQQGTADCADNKARTPLHLAVAAFSDEAVRVLLCEGKCDPRRPDNENRTPLQLAAALKAGGTGPEAAALAVRLERLKEYLAAASAVPPAPQGLKAEIETHADTITAESETEGSRSVVEVQLAWQAPSSSSSSSSSSSGLSLAASCSPLEHCHVQYRQDSGGSSSSAAGGSAANWFSSFSSDGGGGGGGGGGTGAAGSAAGSWRDAPVVLAKSAPETRAEPVGSASSTGSATSASAFSFVQPSSAVPSPAKLASSFSLPVTNTSGFTTATSEGEETSSALVRLDLSSLAGGSGGGRGGEVSFSFRIRAKNRNGFSAWSSPCQVSIPLPIDTAAATSSQAAFPAEAATPPTALATPPLAPLLPSSRPSTLQPLQQRPQYPYQRESSDIMLNKTLPPGLLQAAANDDVEAIENFASSSADPAEAVALLLDGRGAVEPPSAIAALPATPLLLHALKEQEQQLARGEFLSYGSFWHAAASGGAIRVFNTLASMAYREAGPTLAAGRISAALGRRDRFGATPFLLAVFGGHFQLAKRILSLKPSSIDVPDYRGFGALMYAVLRSQPIIFRWLLEAGANPFPLNCRGTDVRGLLEARSEAAGRAAMEAFASSAGGSAAETKSLEHQFNASLCQAMLSLLKNNLSSLQQAAPSYIAAAAKASQPFAPTSMTESNAKALLSNFTSPGSGLPVTPTSADARIPSCMLLDASRYALLVLIPSGSAAAIPPLDFADSGVPLPRAFSTAAASVGSKRRIPPVDWLFAGGVQPAGSLAPVAMEVASAATGAASATGSSTSTSASSSSSSSSGGGWASMFSFGSSSSSSSSSASKGGSSSATSTGIILSPPVDIFSSSYMARKPVVASSSSSASDPSDLLLEGLKASDDSGFLLDRFLELASSSSSPAANPTDVASLAFARLPEAGTLVLVQNLQPGRPYHVQTRVATSMAGGRLSSSDGGGGAVTMSPASLSATGGLISVSATGSAGASLSGVTSSSFVWGPWSSSASSSSSSSLQLSTRQVAASRPIPDSLIALAEESVYSPAPPASSHTDCLVASHQRASKRADWRSLVVRVLLSDRAFVSALGLPGPLPSAEVTRAIEQARGAVTSQQQQQQQQLRGGQRQESAATTAAPTLQRSESTPAAQRQRRYYSAAVEAGLLSSLAAEVLLFFEQQGQAGAGAFPSWLGQKLAKGQGEHSSVGAVRDALAQAVVSAGLDDSSSSSSSPSPSLLLSKAEMLYAAIASSNADAADGEGSGGQGLTSPSASSSSAFAFIAPLASTQGPTGTSTSTPGFRDSLKAFGSVVSAAFFSCPSVESAALWLLGDGVARTALGVLSLLCDLSSTAPSGNGIGVGVGKQQPPLLPPSSHPLLSACVGDNVALLQGLAHLTGIASRPQQSSVSLSGLEARFSVGPRALAQPSALLLEACAAAGSWRVLAAAEDLEHASTAAAKRLLALASAKCGSFHAGDHEDDEEVDEQQAQGRADAVGPLEVVKALLRRKDATLLILGAQDGASLPLSTAAGAGALGPLNAMLSVLHSQGALLPISEGALKDSGGRNPLHHCLAAAAVASSDASFAGLVECAKALVASPALKALRLAEDKDKQSVTPLALFAGLAGGNGQGASSRAAAVREAIMTTTGCSAVIEGWMAVGK